jgi:hypothetical protein
MLGGAPPQVGDALPNGPHRLAEEGENVGPAAAHFHRSRGRAAEKQGHVGLLEAAHLAVRALKLIEMALMVKGFGFPPDPEHHFQVFGGAVIARVVVQPVAILPLFGVAAAGDYMQRNPAAGKLVQRGGFTGGQSGRHEAGPVGDEEPQPLGDAGGVPGHLEPVGGAGRVAGQHHVEPGGLMGSGKLGDVVRVHPRRNFAAGVDAPAENAEAGAGGGRVLTLHANHANDADSARWRVSRKYFIH